MKGVTHGGEVLRALRQPHGLAGAGIIGLASEPDTAFMRRAVGLFLQQRLVPRGRIAIDILIVIVQAEEVVTGPHASRAIGQAFVPAALGVSGHNIRMLDVIAVARPPAQMKEYIVQLDIALEVFGDLGHLVKRPVDRYRLLDPVLIDNAGPGRATA